MLAWRVKAEAEAHHDVRAAQEEAHARSKAQGTERDRPRALDRKTRRSPTDALAAGLPVSSYSPGSEAAFAFEQRAQEEVLTAQAT